MYKVALHWWSDSIISCSLNRLIRESLLSVMNYRNKIDLIESLWVFFLLITER